jgi:hypothetical protein
MNDRLGRRRRASKRARPMLFIAIIVFLFSGCTSLPIAKDDATPVRLVKDGASVVGGAKTATATPAVKEGTATRPAGSPTASDHSAEQVVAIALGDTIAVNGSGASVDGSNVRITTGGTYSISGILKNGQIIVETKDEKTVKLVLNGVSITCASSAPIYVIRAKTTIITLADGTKNHIADGSPYIIDDPTADEPDAAIFSRGNLTFNGNGSLTVEANYRNAIASKRDLSITGGNIAVNAAKDGIRGRDSIAINKGNVKVNAKADGMQSSNKDDPEKGFISIEGGTIDITAGEDGIQAETSVAVSGGSIAVSSGGGSAKSIASGSGGNAPKNQDTPNQSASSTPTVSAKGIKAVTDVKITGGTLRIDSADDALNSNDSVTIDDGKFVLASGDDGIHADSTLTINGGDITITRSYEALEGAVVTINGGSVRLAASDDGVNVSGGHDRAAANGRPNQDNFSSSADKHLAIGGGYVVVDATGDGLDINGWAKMTGGTVIVNGPVVSDQGALDYDREFTMAGGTLVAVGSFGMAQAPDATSTQSSIVLSLGSPQPAGTLVHIEAEDGTGILTFAPIREYQSVVYSSSELKKGSTYNVYIGGRSTGSVVDGVYSGGSYTPGVRSARPTISSIVSGIGSIGLGLPDGKRR